MVTSVGDADAAREGPVAATDRDRHARSRDDLGRIGRSSHTTAPPPVRDDADDPGQRTQYGRTSIAVPRAVPAFLRRITDPLRLRRELGGADAVEAGSNDGRPVQAEAPATLESATANAQHDAAREGRGGEAAAARAPTPIPTAFVGDVFARSRGGLPRGGNGTEEVVRRTQTQLPRSVDPSTAADATSLEPLRSASVSDGAEGSRPAAAATAARHAALAACVDHVDTQLRRGVEGEGDFTDSAAALLPPPALPTALAGARRVGAREEVHARTSAAASTAARGGSPEHDGSMNLDGRARGRNAHRDAPGGAGRGGAPGTPTPRGGGDAPAKGASVPAAPEDLAEMAAALARRDHAAADREFARLTSGMPPTGRRLAPATVKYFRKREASLTAFLAAALGEPRYAVRLLQHLAERWRRPLAPLEGLVHTCIAAVAAAGPVLPSRPSPPVVPQRAHRGPPHAAASSPAGGFFGGNSTRGGEDGLLFARATTSPPRASFGGPSRGAVTDVRGAAEGSGPHGGGVVGGGIRTGAADAAVSVRSPSSFSSSPPRPPIVYDRPRWRQLAVALNHLRAAIEPNEPLRRTVVGLLDAYYRTHFGVGGDGDGVLNEAQPQRRTGNRLQLHRTAHERHERTHDALLLMRLVGVFYDQVGEPPSSGVLSSSSAPAADTDGDAGGASRSLRSAGEPGGAARVGGPPDARAVLADLADVVAGDPGYFTGTAAAAGWRSPDAGLAAAGAFRTLYPKGYATAARRVHLLCLDAALAGSPLMHRANLYVVVHGGQLDALPEAQARCGELAAELLGDMQMVPDLHTLSEVIPRYRMSAGVRAVLYQRVDAWVTRFWQAHGLGKGGAGAEAGAKPNAKTRGSERGGQDDASTDTNEDATRGLDADGRQRDEAPPPLRHGDNSVPAAGMVDPTAITRVLSSVRAIGRVRVAPGDHETNYPFWARLFEYFIAHPPPETISIAGGLHTLASARWHVPPPRQGAVLNKLVSAPAASSLLSDAVPVVGKLTLALARLGILTPELLVYLIVYSDVAARAGMGAPGTSRAPLLAALRGAGSVGGGAVADADRGNTAARAGVMPGASPPPATAEPASVRECVRALCLLWRALASRRIVEALEGVRGRGPVADGSVAAAPPPPAVHTHSKPPHAATVRPARVEEWEVASKTRPRGIALDGSRLAAPDGTDAHASTGDATTDAADDLRELTRDIKALRGTAARGAAGRGGEDGVCGGARTAPSPQLSGRGFPARTPVADEQQELVHAALQRFAGRIVGAARRRARGLSKAAPAGATTVTTAADLLEPWTIRGHADAAQLLPGIVDMLAAGIEAPHVRATIARGPEWLKQLVVSAGGVPCTRAHRVLLWSLGELEARHPPRETLALLPELTRFRDTPDTALPLVRAGMLSVAKARGALEPDDAVALFHACVRHSHTPPTIHKLGDIAARAGPGYFRVHAKTATGLVRAMAKAQVRHRALLTVLAGSAAVQNQGPQRV